MSWEDVDRAFDYTRPDDIVIHLDLARFGELVGRVASEAHRVNGLDQFDPNSGEAAHLAVDAWRYVCHMADRAEFAKSVAADLDKLDAQEAEAPQSYNAAFCPPNGTKQLPEFGGAAPLPHKSAEPPDALNRRLEPPV